MALLIKNFNLVFCCLYSYCKILNINNNKKSKLLNIFICISTTLFTTYVDYQSATFTAITMIILLATQLALYYKQNIAKSFVTTLFLYAIVYACFNLSSIPICLLFIVTKQPYQYTIAQILVLIIQIIIIQNLCKNQRVKKNMHYIWNNQYYGLFSTISLGIVIISTFINQGAVLLSKQATYVPIYYLTIFMCAVTIFIYWRNTLTKAYLDALVRRNNLDLSSQLDELTKKYEALYADKERLSEIVHTDKKLVNSLKNAVLYYLENDNGKDTKRGKELLEEINRYSYAREGNIAATEVFLNPLPTCKITAIDNILAYMYQKATKNNIEFTLSINCDIPEITKSIIDAEDFSTLLADLIDNAIIATTHNDGKLILVSFSIIKKHFTVQISDSGIPFTKEVLLNMGRKQITTHANENGTGIGMMKTYKILQQTNASLYIDEKDASQAPYTKTISVVFNKKHQTVLNTTRNEMEIAYLYQRPDMIVKKK